MRELIKREATSSRILKLWVQADLKDKQLKTKIQMRTLKIVCQIMNQREEVLMNLKLKMAKMI
jgi:hypothetical protein